MNNITNTNSAEDLEFYEFLNKKSPTIAKSFINGDLTECKSDITLILDKYIRKLVEKNRYDDYSFTNLVDEIKSFVNEILQQNIEEQLWEVLSQREIFDETNWENISKQFYIMLTNFINQNAENVVDNILDDYRDSQNYTKNPRRYFGTENM